MTSMIDGLAPNGTLLVVGASSDPIEAVPNKLLTATKRIQGWASGTATDSEDTLRFAEYTGVRPMIEKFPLDKVNEAYNRMTSGKAQFPSCLNDVSAIRSPRLRLTRSRSPQNDAFWSCSPGSHLFYF
jgi:D-arabinose 1-dehydrogenase-like Zn-dependent alcohol dehydrogenase